MNGHGGGKGREGEREKGSCGEGERADGYGLTVERSRRRGADGWARPRQRRRWAGLGWALLVGASRVVCV